MKAEELAAITARATSATPGTWKFEAGRYVSGGAPYSHVIADVQPATRGESNGLFIAHAREDVLALVAEVTRLSARAKSLEGMLLKLTDDEMVMGCDPDGARCCNECGSPIGAPHEDYCLVLGARRLLAEGEVTP